MKPVEGGGELKLQGSNLSKSGMFVKSAEVLQPGTKVSLSLEAKGQAFPFAEAEVVWQRPPANASDEVIPGFGLRFVNFLHPRAPELVDALLDKAAKKKAALEKVAAPLEKFTELSLGDAEKKLETTGEAEPLEAPPIPRRTRTDPEFVRGGESFVIDLQKEIPPEVDFDDDDNMPPPSAFRSNWPKLMGALAFLPLFLVPLGVAIGTWRASKAPEVTVDTRTIEFAQAQPTPAPVVDPLPELTPEQSAAPVVNPQPVENAPAPIAQHVDTAHVDAVPPVKPTPNDVTPKLQARVEPKPGVEAALTAKKSTTPTAELAKKSATLPLELAAVKSITFSSNQGALELSLSLGANATIRRAFALKSPNRLVIDVSGAAAPKSAVHEFAKVSGIQRVRVGALPDGVRLVVDLAQGAKDIKVTGSKVTATLTP